MGGDRVWGARVCNHRVAGLECGARGRAPRPPVRALTGRGHEQAGTCLPGRAALGTSCSPGHESHAARTGAAPTSPSRTHACCALPGLRRRRARTQARSLRRAASEGQLPAACAGPDACAAALAMLNSPIEARRTSPGTEAEPAASPFVGITHAVRLSSSWCSGGRSLPRCFGCGGLCRRDVAADGLACWGRPALPAEGGAKYSPAASMSARSQRR